VSRPLLTGWPEQPIDPEVLKVQRQGTVFDPSPYKLPKPPFFYPGTHLRTPLKEASALLAKQINLVGTHTHLQGDGELQEGEGAFDLAQRMEAEVIWMIADIVGGSKQTVDGFFCGGATEANLQGMWIGREWLRHRPDPMNHGIVVLATPLFHYSINKAVEILDLGSSQKTQCPLCLKDHVFLPDNRGCGLNLVAMDSQGQMLMEDLERVFRLKLKEGFRRFLIVPTVGTTVMGSIDPVRQIGDFVHEQERQTSATFYIHIDAAFGGFTVPFVEPERRFGFEYESVMSIALDADKMGQMPYPAGVFLCRKGLQNLVAERVNYIRGGHDDTVPGSRSALTPVLANLYFKRIGRSGQRKYVSKCIKGRDRLRAKLIERFPASVWPAVNVLECSPSVNILPLEVDIQDGCIPASILDGRNLGKSKSEIAADRMNLKSLGLLGLRKKLAAYHFRHDLVPRDFADIASCPRTVYKVCVMPHVLKKGLIDQFVDDLGAVVSAARSAMLTTLKNFCRAGKTTEQADGLRVTLIEQPSVKFKARHKSLLEVFRFATADAFGLDSFMIDDVRRHVLEPDYLAIARNSGGDLVGYASASQKDSPSYLYLDGVAITKGQQNKNLARTLIRALVKHCKAETVAFTTQNPLLFSSVKPLFKSVFPSPPDPAVPKPVGEADPAIPELVRKIAKSIMRRRSGELNPSTLVVRKLYRKCLYRQIPEYNVPEVRSWFEKQLRICDGRTRDGFVLVCQGRTPATGFPRERRLKKRPHRSHL